jgi:hypothetical protein
MKASHAWNVADVVSSIFPQSATNRQRLHGQKGPCEMIVFRTKNIGQNGLDCFVRTVEVGGIITCLDFPCHVNRALIWGCGAATTMSDLAFGRTSGGLNKKCVRLS